MEIETPRGIQSETPPVIETPAPPTRRRRAASGIHASTAAGKAGDAARRIQVAMMAAGQCTPAAIARGLLISRQRVDQILKETETAKLVEETRAVVRAHVISESVNIAVKGMAWVNEALDTREAKEFDLVTRGMANMEKVWSSASGEHKPQGVQVAVFNQQPGEASAEIAKLVERLLEPTA